MKIARKKLKAISLLMAFLVLYMSCAQYDSDLTLDEPNYKLYNEPSGEDLFQGLFFFGNDLSKQIDIIAASESFYRYENDIKFKNEMDKLNSNIIEEIKKEDKYFFNNFKALVTSGKHLKVKEAYKLASIHIFNALPKLEQFKDYDFERFEKLNIADYLDENGNLIDNEKLAKLFPKDEYAQDSKAICGLALVCVLAVIAVTYVVAVQVLAVAWVVAVYAAFAFWSDKTANLGTHDYEATINQIVEIYVSE